MQSSISTFLIVASSAVLFCSKGVFIKAALALGLDVPTVLALRMVFAAPFFVVVAWVTERRARAAGNGLVLSDAGWAIGLGFLGYYFSSLLNATGLQFVSVGLERMVLYTYPSIVLVVATIRGRSRPSGKIWAAMSMAYLGIVLAFFGELRMVGGDPVGRTAFGAGLVFASAVTYALFLFLCSGTLERVGSVRFTVWTMLTSVVFILGHFVCVHEPTAIVGLPSAAYGYGMILAIFGTVAPAFLMAAGLRRAGPSKFAVISTVGPVVSIVLAWLVLGEIMRPLQVVGFALCIGGGLWVSLGKAELGK